MVETGPTASSTCPWAHIRQRAYGLSRSSCFRCYNELDVASDCRGSHPGRPVREREFNDHGWPSQRCDRHSHISVRPHAYHRRGVRSETIVAIAPRNRLWPLRGSGSGSLSLASGCSKGSIAHCHHSKCDRSAAVLKDRQQAFGDGCFRRTLYFSTKPANGGLQSTSTVPGNRQRRERVKLRPTMAGLSSARSGRRTEHRCGIGKRENNTSRSTLRGFDNRSSRTCHP
jgi:hypothetical protein